MLHLKYVFSPSAKSCSRAQQQPQFTDRRELICAVSRGRLQPPSDRRIGGFVSGVGGTLRDVAHAAQLAGNHDSQSKQKRSAGTSRGSAAITHRRLMSF